MFDDVYLAGIENLSSIGGAFVLRDIEIDCMHPDFAKKIAERESEDNPEKL
jgi:hypothetical protein